MSNDNQHLIGLLNDVRMEIRHLRHANEIMAAKLDVYETFKRMVMGTPGPQGMAPDICFAIEREILSLEAEDARRPTAA